MNLHETLALYGTELPGVPAAEILKSLFRLRDSVCGKIAERCGTGLQGLLHAAPAELEALGCTRVQAERILLAVAVGRRIAMPAPVRNAVSSPAEVYALMSPILSGKSQEEFWTLNLDTKSRLVSTRMVTKGLVDRSPVHPREVFRTAIAHNSSRVILVHNHPSGDPVPSANDISSTRLLVDAGRIVGIEVVDHIIVGVPCGIQPGYVSFRELGLLPLDNKSTDHHEKTP